MIEQIQILLGGSFIDRMHYYPILVSLIVFALATITDMKRREVPDTLNYLYLGTGLSYAIILSLISSNVNIIINSIFGLGVAYAIASLLYYMGQWGGGDAKLLMGFGAWHGLFYTAYNITFSNILILHYIVVLFIAGGIYGLLYLLALLWKNRREFMDKHNDRQAKSIILLALSLMLLTIGIIIGPPLNMIALVLALSLSLLYLLMRNSKRIEDTLFIKEIDVNKLTEGDWILEDIKVGKKVIAKKTGEGISKDDIELLKKYHDKGKINKVRVREGIPFVPAFLIGYILLLLV
ncbi:MAG: prepilin peptidase [Candidatus Woesearchaeota archaeon]